MQGTHFCRITLSRETVCEIVDQHFIMFGCMNTEARPLATKFSLGSGNSIGLPLLVGVRLCRGSSWSSVVAAENVNPFLILVNPTQPHKVLKRFHQLACDMSLYHIGDQSAPRHILPR